MVRGAVRALVIGAVAVGLSGCWPVPGHDPDRTGYDDLETAITPATVGGLRQRWAWSGSPNLSAGVRSPVVSSGGVHALAGCTLVTVAPGTGAERWRVELPVAPEFAGWPCDGYMRRASDPFVHGGEVFAGSLFRFDGRPPPTPVEPVYDAITTSWDVRTGDPTPGGLGVQGTLEARRGDVVAALGGEGGFTGTPPLLTPYVRTFPLLGTAGGPQRRLPTGGDGRVTIGPDAAYVVAGATLQAFAVEAPPVGCGDGTAECPLWEVNLGSSLVGHPVLGDGTVFVGTGAGTVHALDAATGATSWTAQVGSAVTGAPALAHGTLHVPTEAGDLVAVPAGGCGAEACAPAWSGATGSAVTGQPVVAGDVVLTGSADGALRAFDAAGCGGAACPALWSATTGSPVTGLAVSGGTFYVGTADTRLLAYGLP